MSISHHSETPLILYNSLSRMAETFVPIDPDMVRLYSCGPTVYNFTHIGNLRAYVFTDTLRRALNWKGYAVNHVINITDVGHLTSDADAGDDKMEAAAAETGKSIWDVAAFYTDAFKANLRALSILDPTIWSTATDHIQDMISFAARIEDGHCYQLDSGLYFDCTSIAGYGRLARTVEDEGESRIDPVEGKRNPQDFAIWRASAPGENRQMEWQSPWGPGAPGWHLECSVMSMKYLGSQFDIHTGGIDHREIHHCNEIAQNQAFTCSDNSGANWWMHNNFLIDRGGKMSKSKGGFTTLSSLVDLGVPPLAYRLLCLSAHYRSEMEFSGENLTAAITRLKRLVISVTQLREKTGLVDWLRTVKEAGFSKGASFAWQRSILESDLSPLARSILTEFDAAISADLMTPRALPILEDVTTNTSLSAEERLKIVASMDLALGLNLLEITRADLRIRPASAAITETEIEALLETRQNARATKDFATSDSIRDDLSAKGVEIMDGDPLRWDWAIKLH